MPRFFIINPSDNVATALTDLDQGEVVDIDDRTITLAKPIEMGHKFAIESITKDGEIIKYGEIIGIARKDIHPGDRVNENNIRSRDLVPREET
jgi:predicted RecA/RadA family phage recombinase